MAKAKTGELTISLQTDVSLQVDTKATEQETEQEKNIKAYQGTLSVTMQAQPDTELPEGELTKLRASLVCEKSLCEFSTELHMGEFLRLGHGEELMGGRERPSILADAFEAVLAAIYLDGGIEPATEFVLKFVKRALAHVENVPFKDYKTLLQEIIQKNPEERLNYDLVGESGPDHDKRFEVNVMLNSNIIGHGIGKSKKSAEQLAAKEALELMGE